MNNVSHHLTGLGHEIILKTIGIKSYLEFLVAKWIRKGVKII